MDVSFDFMKSNRGNPDSSQENEDILTEKVSVADSVEKEPAVKQPELQNGYLALVREYEELLEQKKILEARVEECRKNVETEEENYARENRQKYQELIRQRKELRKRVGDQKEKILEFYYQNHDILANDHASDPEDKDYFKYVSKTCEMAGMFDRLYSFEKEREFHVKPADDMSDGRGTLTETETQLQDDENNVSLENARETLQQAIQKLDENSRTLIRCNEDLVNWNTFPVLNDGDPSLQNEILVRQGDSTDDFVFVFRHDLKPVNIRYTGADLQGDISTALKEVLYRLQEGFGKINAPDLLQIHIIDENNGGKALQIDPRFLGKIRSVEQINQYVPGTYVYGKNTRLLKDYLSQQWDSIIKCMSENPSRIDQTMSQQHPQDYPIFFANKVRRKPTGGIAQLPPFPYKVLFILVPREEDEGAGSLDIKELLGIIDDSSLCTSGILPIFFSNADSVNEKYQKYVDKCARCFEVDLSCNKMRKV